MSPTQQVFSTPSHSHVTRNVRIYHNVGSFSFFFLCSSFLSCPKTSTPGLKRG